MPRPSATHVSCFKHHRQLRISLILLLAINQLLMPTHLWKGKPTDASYLGRLFLLLPLLFFSLHQPLFGQEELLIQHVCLVFGLRVGAHHNRKEGEERTCVDTLSKPNL